MRLVRHSPDELVLLHRPVILCAVLGAGTLLLAWVALWNANQGEWLKAGLSALCTFGLMAPAVWFAAERVDVRFDARAGDVRIRTRRLSGNVDETHPLDRVKQAMVQTHKGPSGSDGSHRVALEFQPGGVDKRLALTTGYASGRSAADLVARINDWLEAKRSTD